MNEKVEIDPNDFEGFTARGDVFMSDEQTINDIITPWNKFSALTNTLKQDIAQSVESNNVGKNLVNFYNRSVTSLQINVTDPLSAIVKNPYRGLQKGEYQDDFLDQDTIENMSDFVKEKYFPKMTSFASSDLGGLGTNTANPENFSRTDWFKERVVKDM